jgi:hypothetical protein
MAISVTTQNETITAAVTDEKVTATVSQASAVSATVTAGFGPAGPQGPQGAAGASSWNDITGKPATFPPASHTHSLADLSQSSATSGQVVQWNGTAWVAGTVSAGSSAWNDITGKPATFAPPVATASVLGGVKQGSNVTIGVDGTISVAAPFSGSYSDLTGKPTLFSGAYSDLTGRPTLGTAAAAASTDFAAASHAHGNITTAGAIGSTTGQIVVTTTSGVLTTAASISTSQVSGLGTLATQSGTFSGTSSGTNTGDQTITLSGDVTGSGTGSFAATLASTGVAAASYGSASSVATFTVDAKGRLTTAGSTSIAIAASAVTSGTFDAARIPTIAYSALSGVPSTFAPSTHKSSHATGGADALTPADIGAAASSHTHSLSSLTQSSATTNQVPQWNGSAWVPATVSSGSSSASDLTSGTLNDARLSFVPIHPFLLMGG